MYTCVVLDILYVSLNPDDVLDVSPVRPSATFCLEMSPALTVVTTTPYRAPGLSAVKLMLLVSALTLWFLITLLSWISRTW